MLDEGMQAAGDGGAGGVMAGRGDDDVVGRDVNVGEEFAVDAGVGDRRRQVVGRVSRRALVMPWKYPKKSSRVVSSSSGVVPRWNSSSWPPNSSWVSLSSRGKSDSGRPSRDRITYSG